MTTGMEETFKTILKKIRSNKTVSSTTNPISESIETQSMQRDPKMKMSIEIRASEIDNSESEDKDYPLRGKEMRNLRHPATLAHQNE